MELARGHRAKDSKKIRHSLNAEVAFNSETLLVIKVPDLRALRVLSRSVFLATVILTLPFILSILRGLASSSYLNLSAYDFGSDLTDINVEFLDLLLEDLANEGLIKNGDKALIVSSGIGAVFDSSRFLNANEIDLVSESDLEQEMLFPNATFNFALALSPDDARLVDRIMKVGGIVVTQLNNEMSNAFEKQSNYRIVYLRRYESTIVAMRKTSLVNELQDSPTKKRPCQLAFEAKREALKGLEDVLLEPPRKALAKSRLSFNKFKYLPDLLGDSLEDYKRRVFINVDLQEETSNKMAWFNENYPTRNQEFEFHHIGMLTEGNSRRVASCADVSNWLMKNVRKGEFVVMKAEAEVVEEMIKRRTIRLVDELFLECANQWQDWGKKKSKRAYWQCLALYGRLRDEGVAVHQWWG